MYLTGIRIKRTKKVGNNMNFKIRNLLAAAMAFVMMISLTACSSDKQKKYEQTYEQETASMKLSKEEKAARKAKAKEEKERAKKIQ